jgi:hypothetical protein
VLDLISKEQNAKGCPAPQPLSRMESKESK